MTMSKKEIQLIRSVKRGDRLALSELVSLYFDRMERHGKKICGNREDAEEVMQETFAVAINAMSDIKHEAGFGSWLYKVASSICTKKRRKRREESGHDMEAVPGDGSYLHSETILPEAIIQNVELRQALGDGLDSLNPALRDAVSLVDFQGYSGDEAAKRLGVEHEALRTRLHRGRQQLRAFLASRK